MRSRRLQPLDVATGVVSGALAATFLTLGALAALPDDASAPPSVVEPAAAHP
ncbi:hypothetical protein ABFT23_09715 [Nocardioides sp. C4-1]|uniref:hypothetical protein n=1 Tax=Nocardioides sp. C4-1 TaxID=3151851 RepID=UPI0032635AC3